jgi:hypothetical protein
MTDGSRELPVSRANDKSPGSRHLGTEFRL